MALTYIGSSRAVIDAPGDYTIDRDLTSTDPNLACVYINPGVHYVTLRLRSRLVGAYGPYGNNTGIYASGSAAVTLIGDGGSIRGFTYGVRFENTYLARIERLFVQDAHFRGIKLSGDDCVISNCDIREIHGAMFTPSAYCMGIEVSGMSPFSKPKVLRNFVQNVYGSASGGNTGEGVGISISDKGRGAVVSGNVIQNDVLLGLPLAHGACMGIWVGGDSDVLVSGNTIKTFDHGLLASSPTTVSNGQNLYVDCTEDWVAGGINTPSTQD